LKGFGRNHVSPFLAISQGNHSTELSKVTEDGLPKLLNQHCLGEPEVQVRQVWRRGAAKTSKSFVFGLFRAWSTDEKQRPKVVLEANVL